MSFPTFIEALRDASRYPHPCQQIQVLETHISWVVLTGPFAYKVKKPVDLGFLDYTTLERRHRFCLDELRINRRLAPHVYLGVVPITGTPEAPLMDGPGEAFEYAVKMHQFDQDDLLDRRLQHGLVDPRLIDTLAETIAEFHEGVERAPADSRFGTPAVVQQAVAHNFEAIRANLPTEALPAGLDELQAWARRRFTALRPILIARRHDGFVRECHGDMHLGNIALVDGRVTIFDAIEFNDALRWIDIASEIAFITMDLDDRRRPGWSRRLLNRYLQRIGDYGGVQVLRYYQSYRALVRAKVASIRARQCPDAQEREALAATCADYVALARRYSVPGKPAILITRGVSGSGKSTLARELVEHSELIWIRSDVERKRLFGLAPERRGDGQLGAGIYGRQASDRTYERLLQLAETIVTAGFPVLVDATFLDPTRVTAFQALATRLHIPFRILETTAPAEVLRQRVESRRTEGGDPSDAGPEVLARQLQEWVPLSGGQRSATLSVDTSIRQDPATLLEKLGLVRVF